MCVHEYEAMTNEQLQEIISTLTVDNLKAELKQHNLSVQGKKQDLFERLDDLMRTIRQEKMKKVEKTNFDIFCVNFNL